MKRILILRTAPFNANPRGYNVQEMGLAKAFCKMGYDVDWYSFKKGTCETFTFYETGGCSAKCIEIPRIRIFRWGYNSTVLEDEFLSHYDIVVCFEYMQLMSYLIGRKIKNGILYSGPYYNLFTLKFISPLYDYICTKTINNAFKGKFTKSVFAKQYMEKKGYTDINVVGVGLDVNRFNQEIQIKPDTQKLINYMKTHICILYVGALSDRKNYPFLLDIYKKILEREPNVKFVIIGKSVNNPLLKLIGKKDEDYAARYDSTISPVVKDGITHIERIDNDQLKYIYPLAKAFLLPSKLEIFGMVLLESMYLGAPVVSSRNGGSETLIEGKNTGLIVDEFDADKWADAVMKYLKNSDYMDLVKNNAHRLIETEYNWDVIASKMISEI